MRRSRVSWICLSFGVMALNSRESSAEEQENKLAGREERKGVKYVKCHPDAQAGKSYMAEGKTSRSRSGYREGYGHWESNPVLLGYTMQCPASSTLVRMLLLPV